VIVRPPFVVARIDGDELSLHVLRRDADSLQGVDHLRQLAHNFGVFLTMGYFTYRSHRPLFSGAYTRLNISLLREWTGNAALPVHAIGGLARDASPAQVRAFVGAAHAGDALGSSLYDFADTSPRQWLELRLSNDVS